MNVPNSLTVNASFYLKYFKRISVPSNLDSDTLNTNIKRFFKLQIELKILDYIIEPSLQPHSSFSTIFHIKKE